MLVIKRFDVQVRAHEAGFHVCAHKVFEMIALAEACTDWRVMTHLFGKVLICRSEQFKGLSENWVERFRQPINCTFILGDTKASDIHHSFDWIWAFISLFK